MATDETEKRLAQVPDMSRDDLCRAILAIDCDFSVDFTAKQLRSLSMEKLRHVYLALCLHGKNHDGDE